MNYPNDGEMVCIPDPTPMISLRDWFAGQAMVAIVTASEMGVDPCPLGTYARDAYRMADAMIAARKGK